VIGFVGLGNIGGAMAARLDPAELLVHDVREEAAAPFVERRRSSSARDVGSSGGRGVARVGLAECASLRRPS